MGAPCDVIDVIDRFIRTFKICSSSFLIHSCFLGGVHTAGVRRWCSAGTERAGVSGGGSCGGQHPPSGEDVPGVGTCVVGCTAAEPQAKGQAGQNRHSKNTGPYCASAFFFQHNTSPSRQAGQYVSLPLVWIYCISSLQTEPSGERFHVTRTVVSQSPESAVR